MPHYSKLSRSRPIYEACSIASNPLVEFLTPILHEQRSCTIRASSRSSRHVYDPSRLDGALCENAFFSALSRATRCTIHQKSNILKIDRRHLTSQTRVARFSTTTGRSEKLVYQRKEYEEGQAIAPSQENGKPIRGIARGNGSHNNVEWSPSTSRTERYKHPVEESQLNRGHLTQTKRDRSIPTSDTAASLFAQGSQLPNDFFDDVSRLQSRVPSERPRTRDRRPYADTLLRRNKHKQRMEEQADTRDQQDASVPEQLKLLQSVRDLEEKLFKAKKDLEQTFKQDQSPTQVTLKKDPEVKQLTLSKEDYMNLVDLYFYSHNSRFSPESTDLSPTPLFLNDYSFTLSSDFTKGKDMAVNEDENYESPLKHIHEMLKSQQLKEVAVMQIFVDLLLDDRSSNRALFEAYQNLPEPGVSYLPNGILRVFLQRMSTPWTKSEKTMLRYLSLIDDMQKAGIPVTRSEWSSAVYLAGRSFSQVTSNDVASAFRIWQDMEQNAGVQGSHVTFNILFDIAVRAGKFALGETILKEMHKRNLRLNRLGRVSLIYYHGLRGDGDGVRKAYRDFVEAGEIVDTLVLNCVIASLLNAQEPAAAEQVYERMKSAQSQLEKSVQQDGQSSVYKRYPGPGADQIGQEMASACLGRILHKAPNLQRALPETHAKLQDSMPLTPDHLTFRSMIAYHATKSGNLDRLSVLLNDMTELFQLPLQTLTFQLLFKGFAINGPTQGPDGQWTRKRLDLCWKACISAIKDARVTTSSKNASISNNPQADETDPDRPSLPSVQQIDSMPRDATNFLPPLSRPPPRRLSSWTDFVLDLAAFPRERLKRIERFHAEVFDDEQAAKPHESGGLHTYEKPFFQSTVYTSPEPALDQEEGEYVLPNPTDTSLMVGSSKSEPSDQSEASTETSWVVPTRSLICWVLRAYARNTKSRSRVEEVWNQIRKVWKPKDPSEREAAVRVLGRCLRDCDREGSG